eukprot:CAMPEP_0182422500 /NCGR_PEP_ID=MMETSP1167-20130531/8230_1 /TAXON_ID=2988 /ORGANISM="Mallomonas Sp, Strain CCMP3275" /LENGTH=300 /DNA_ID=CAMNT_0024600631 /DNA_START=258 /DNA_END=1160 /DNA_ORIENTATION=-
MAVRNGVNYYAERFNNKTKKNGLSFTTSLSPQERMEGFDIQAEDPRMFVFNNTVYVFFIALAPPGVHQSVIRGIYITPFDQFQPVFLNFPEMQPVEKNWAPMVIADKLHIVYSFDPVIVLSYDFNRAGNCSVVHRAEGALWPFDTARLYLRGGTNMVPFYGDYYIGACHSRLQVGGRRLRLYHFAHVVVLDVVRWRLLFVSKPVKFMYTAERYDNVEGVLLDHWPWCVQDPVSMFRVSEKSFYMSISVADRGTLLYEVTPDISHLISEEVGRSNRTNGHWDTLTEKMLRSIIRIKPFIGY